MAAGQAPRAARLRAPFRWVNDFLTAATRLADVSRSSLVPACRSAASLRLM